MAILTNDEVLAGHGTSRAARAYRTLVAHHGHDGLCDAYGLDRDDVDGGTHWTDIIPTQEIAGTAFDLIVSGDMPGIDYPTGTEYTVREIVNGEILAEATILDGEVLDSISRR